MSHEHQERLAELASRQGGVFARWQALELGFTHFMIAHRLETKEWRRVVGSVLMAATGHLSRVSGDWAAYLACGPGAVLTGPSALRWHGVPIAALPIEEWQLHWVTIPPERHVRVARVRTIREALPQLDIMVVNDMRVTTIGRAVVDTLRVLPERFGRDVLDRALLRGWLTLAELHERTYAFAGRRGVGRLRYHLGRVNSGARSEAERILHKLLEEADLAGWVAGYEIRSPAGVLLAVLDVAFPASGVAVEIDGLAFHSDPTRFQGDRTRQNAIVLKGWNVLRFTWDDLTLRPSYVRMTIIEALQDPTPRSGFRVFSEN